MYYKLVQSTDFDAVDGGMMMTAKEVIAIVPANCVKDAWLMFEFLKRHGLIYYTGGCVEVEPASRSEFEDYIKN